MTTKRKPQETKFRKAMSKLSDETFCVKKTQFELLTKNSVCYEFFGLRNDESRFKIDKNHWELFDENKDCYWFRRKTTGE